jgi:hypothetical protein
MAPPRHADLVNNYTSKVKRARKWRDTAGYDDLWKRLRDLYRGHQGETEDEDQMIVNMAFATLNVIAPSVSVNNPKFTVSARQPDHAAQAVITEEVLNYIWRTHHYQHQFRLAVVDWLMFGHGWMKVGYKFTHRPVAVNDDDSDPGDEGVDDRDPVPGNIESETHDVVEDRPFAERVSVWDMYCDPDSRTMENLAWIAQKIRRRVTDVHADKRYRNAKVRNNVQPDNATSFEDDADDNPPPESRLDSKDKGFVDIIEFWDIRKEEYSVFALNSTEGFLIPPEPWPYAFGHPFLRLENYAIPDEFYPLGELESIETLQLELNETRSQMLNHRKRFSRKYLYLESAFDNTGVELLQSSEDNLMVPVNGGEDLQRVIIPMPSIGIAPDFYQMSQTIEDDIDKVSGVSDYMRGQMPETRRTATEAAMLQDAQQSRFADKVSKVENFLALLGERLIQLLQQFMTGEQVVRVVGMDGSPLWLTYDLDYIQGQFDYEVEAGSTQPQNETFKRQAAMQMVDAMAPFLQAGVVNPQAIARYVLQFGFGIKDPTSFLMVPPPGMAGPPQPPAEGTPEQPGQLPPGPEGGPPPEGGGGPPQGGEAGGPMPAGPPGPGPGPAVAPPVGGGQVPPEAMEQLMQLPPQQIAALVQSGQLPPEIAQMVVAQHEAQAEQVQQPLPPPPPQQPPI